MFFYLLIFLSSCSSFSPINQEIKADQGSPTGLPFKMEPAKAYEFKNSGLEGTVTKFTFGSFNEAKAYAMERRLLILRKFEVLIEPYFGTANAKNCQDNLDSSLLESDERNFQSLLQLPVKGSERTIHDCLTENNTHWAKVQFLVCDKNFYDIRTYSPIGQTQPYKPLFSCRSE